GTPVVVVDRPPLVEGKVPPFPPPEGSAVEVEVPSPDEPAPPQPVSTAPAIITRKATAAAPDFVPNFVPNLECFCIPWTTGGGTRPDVVFRARARIRSSPGGLECR